MTIQEKNKGAGGTLCWTCKWAAGKEGKCPWVREFKPVKGWEATPDEVLIASKTKTPDGLPKYTDSYTVITCPLYEKDSVVVKHKQMMERMLEEQRKANNEKVDEIEKEVERLWIIEHLEAKEISALLEIPLRKLYKIRKKIKERYHGK